MNWLPLSSPPDRDCNVLLFFGDAPIDDDDCYAQSRETTCEARDERLELGFYKAAYGGSWHYMGTAHDIFETDCLPHGAPTLYAIIDRPAA